MLLIQEACKYAMRGWKVFPLIPGEKRPIQSGGFHNATDDIEAICSWNPNCNIGVATGSVSGFWVLDIDIKGESNGVESMKKAIAKYGDLPETLVQQTASGGYHYFFKQPDYDWAGNSNGDTGIDVRANRGYTIVPPSRLIKTSKHEAGSYKWLNDNEIAEAPNWLYEWITSEYDAYMKRRAQKQGGFNEGGRNCALTSMCGKWRAKGLEYEEILELAKLENLKNNPPMDEKEVQTIVKSVSKYPAGQVPDEYLEFDAESLLKIINPLGIHEGNYVFYSQETMCMQYLSPTALSKKENLESICNYNLLLDFFPSDKEYNSSRARRFFMQECKKKGLYKPKNLAGVGIWKDNDNKDIVINTGNSLVVNGVITPYDQYNSKVTYANHKEAKIKLDLMLNDEEINFIVDSVCNYTWKEKYYGYLVLGSLIQAVIGGVLRWRSHLWIIAPAGSGKSTIQKSFIQKLLGIMCVDFAGANTTEAGIRQDVGENGYTVCIDDIDARDNFNKIQQIILLARICSSDDQTISKGSASGKAIKYRCQSPFIISSIKTYLSDRADIERFNVVELKSQKECDIEEKERFMQIEKNIIRLMTTELSNKFIAHVMNEAPNVIGLIEDMKHTLHEKGMTDRRQAEQWAGLLGCAKLFVDFDLDFIDDIIEQTRKDFSLDDDEAALAFEKLFNSFIDIPTDFNSEKMTVRQALLIYKKESERRILDAQSKYNLEDIKKRLYIYGFKVIDDNVAISLKSEFVDNVLGPSWGPLMSRLSFTEKSQHSISFGGRTSKSYAWFVPLENIILDDEEEVGF